MHRVNSDLKFGNLLGFGQASLRLGLTLSFAVVQVALNDFGSLTPPLLVTLKTNELLAQGKKFAFEFGFRNWLATNLVDYVLELSELLVNFSLV